MATERTRHRRGEGGKLREEILNAVNRLLDEWGSVERLTIRAVAAETGVAAPSIYMHFKDKTDLVWAALSDKYQQLATQMRIADEKADQEGPVERLRAQVHAYCLFGLKNPGHYRLLYETRQPQADTDRVRHHHAALDVFAVPRLDERVCRLVTPLKPVEAMAGGLPVVASDLAALREIVEPGVTGELIPAGESARLADVLTKLAYSHETRTSYGQAGQERVGANRTWTGAAYRYNQAYRVLIRKMSEPGQNP